MAEHVDVVAKLLAYHGDLAALAKRWVAVADFLDEDGMGDVRRVLKDMRDPLIAQHFMLEEQVLFPAILKSSVPVSIRGLVHEWIAEHASIMKLFDDVSAVAAAVPEGGKPDPVALARMRMMLKTLSRIVSEHIQRENLQIPGIVDGNPSIMFMIGRNYMMQRSRFEAGG